MSAQFCDYCFDNPGEKQLLCNHWLCKSCEIFLNKNRIQRCPIDQCLTSLHTCKIHNQPYVSICQKEFLPLCTNCEQFHIEHVITEPAYRIDFSFLSVKMKKNLQSITNNRQEIQAKKAYLLKKAQELYIGCYENFLTHDKVHKLSEYLKTKPSKYPNFSKISFECMISMISLFKADSDIEPILDEASTSFYENFAKLEKILSFLHDLKKI